MLEELKGKKIAVLAGGRSGERDVSLRSGKRVFDSLKSQAFDVISLDTDGELISKLKSEKVDLVCIMLHGKYGEDGTIQGLLESFDIPYTGSKVLASALAMNKVASKRIFDALNIPTPKYVVINQFEDLGRQAEKIRGRFPLPLVVKPVAEGSSLGVTIVKSGEELEPVIRKTVERFGEVFVEEHIHGTEVTVGILGVGASVQALPILELVPKSEFYDFEAKYTKGQTEFVIPARLPKLLYEEAQRTALAAHHALGCHGVSRVDIIVSPDGVPFVHDVNTIPGMTELSDLPAEAQVAGISYDELVVRILESALS
jgi:D-alanine-D-alanine ligase